MFAAATAWPGCGRSACRSAAKTRAVPSMASTLIAAVTSAVRSSRSRSVQASSSWPSMPSVPLMRARPSFSASATGSSPAASRASAAGRSGAGRRRGPCPSPISASATWASGARSPEQPERAELVHDRGDAVLEQRGQGLGGGRAHAGVPGGQRRQAQQHHRPHDLALDLGAAAGGVRADQRALQLRALLERDVLRGQRAEARSRCRSAARRRRPGSRRRRARRRSRRRPRGRERPRRRAGPRRRPRPR